METTNEQLIKKIDELQSKRLAHRLSDKIKEALSFVGFILSTLGAVGYLATIFIIVMGAGGLTFELMGKDGMFFVIGLAFGLFIRTGFYIQGITYAKMEFKPILTEYYNTKATYDAKHDNQRQKRRKSFEFKLTMEIARTTIIQVAVFLVSGMGLIYLAGFEGMNNGVYIGNAISNLLMFTGFGFLALNSSYEKYIMYKIPRLKEETNIMKKSPE
jgi:hypothetical protein